MNVIEINVILKYIPYNFMIKIIDKLEINKL